MQGVIYGLVAAGGAAVWHLIQSRFGGKPAPAPGSPASPVAPTAPATPAASSKHPFLTYLEEAAIQMGHEVLTNLFQQALRGGIPGVPVLQPPTIPAAPVTPKS